VCKDRAEGVEGVEGDGAVGGVGVVLDTIYLSVKNLRCMVHDTAVNRRQNDGPEAEEMLNQTKHNKRKQNTINEATKRRPTFGLITGASAILALLNVTFPLLSATRLLAVKLT